MTHAYSAGGSRRGAVLTAIIGLHAAVLLVVLNDQIRAFPTAARDPGPIIVLPPKPEKPVIVPPDKLGPPEPFGQSVENPEIPIPDFGPNDITLDASAAGGESRDGVLPSARGSPVLTPASLQGLSRDFAAVVRACYPAGARRDGDEGRLLLAVTIGARGQTLSGRVVERTGFPRLDAAAPCVLDKLRFNAAREDGRVVQSEVLLPIVFRLD